MIVENEKELAKILHISPRSFYHHTENGMSKEDAMEYAINCHNVRIWKHRCPKEWRVFHNMKKRTTDKNDPRYKKYGQVGMSPEFTSRFGFLNFIRAIGPMPDYSMVGKKIKWSVDRIDNGRGYFPENIRWATPKQQANNRDNMFKYHEKLKRNGVPLSTFYGRIKRGWSPEEAATSSSKRKEK